MAELTRMQSVKQGTRNFLHKASDKMKIAGAKTTGGDTKVGAPGRARRARREGTWHAHTSRSEPLTATLCAPALQLQELDVAIVKATTCNFHVVPKEKHVRSEPALRRPPVRTALASCQWAAAAATPGRLAAHLVFYAPVP